MEHSRDTLAGMSLVEYRMPRWCRRCSVCSHGMLLVLEGGYHQSALSASVLSVLRVLDRSERLSSLGHDGNGAVGCRASAAHRSLEAPRGL